MIHGEEDRMIARSWSTWLAWPLVVLASAGSAGGPDQPIIVEGRPTAEKHLDQFIATVLPAPVHGQLGRFETAVCPVAAGLSREQDELVAMRMRHVAQAAGIPVARPGCRANVILIVSNDKSALIGRLLRERSYMFPKSWGVAHIHALARDPAPAAAWSVTDVVTADGQPLNYSVEAPFNRTSRMLSRLAPAARPYSRASVVIVQASALEGLTTTQLADYAAMRALAPVSPPPWRGAALPTILTALETPIGQPVPLTLTSWDLSLLRSFYSTRLNANAGYQRAQLRGLMKRDARRRQQ
jgi:hypothetical protein